MKVGETTDKFPAKLGCGEECMLHLEELENQLFALKKNKFYDNLFELYKFYLQ